MSALFLKLCFTAAVIKQAIMRQLYRMLMRRERDHWG